MRKLLLAFAFALVALPAFAAVTGNNAITPQALNVGVCQFLQGTDVAGTYKTCVTAGANGTICKGAWETNTDTTATHLVTVQIVRSAVKYGGVAFTTGLGDGTVSGLNAVMLMGSGRWPLPTDSDGNGWFLLANGDTVQATFATALTAATLINLDWECFDF